MKKIDEIKKWDYNIVFDDTKTVFSKFEEQYSKNREMARYYIYRHPLQSNRIVAFIKDNVQIIKQERIKYGVSISLKKYKSSKEEYKFYFDTNNGSITKSKNGKFIQCKPSDIPLKIRDYIMTQKKWMSFIFELNLPITFNTIVTKKLYSKRKLLSWYYGCNYDIALKINTLYDERFVLKENIKSVKNINNINPEFFTNQNYRRLFIELLYLSIKTMRKINAGWSYNRIENEIKSVNRYILNVINNNTDEEELKIHDNFLPILKTLKDNDYQLIKTNKELIKYCKSELLFYNLIDNSDKQLFLLKNKQIYKIYWTTDYKYTKSADNKITFRYDVEDYSINSISNNIFNSNPKSITNKELKDILENISKNYDNLVLAYNRKNKMKQIIINIENYEDNICEKEDDFFFL